jgi:hypothetical protein
MGIAGGKPDCGRYLRQSQPAHLHGPACPQRHSELGPVRVHLSLDATHFDLPGERPMFEFRDLFQWDRFITPASNETKQSHFVGTLEVTNLTPIREH